MLGNMLFVTELLITGTRYLQIVFIVKLLIFLRSISHLHGNRDLYSLEVRVDVTIVGNGNNNNNNNNIQISRAP